MTSTPFLSEYDLHLLAEGTHYRTYEKLGAHACEQDGASGAHFAVWAPNARSLSVVGDFNHWDSRANRMVMHPEAGVWSAFVPGVQVGDVYKYVVEGPDGEVFQKADPHAFFAELRPRSASRVWDLSGYAWGDGDWMSRRRESNALSAPISIYEVHLGSWMRVPDEGNRWLTYRELASRLVEYVADLGCTHVELMPVMEHPFDGSWGYQVIGHFAPTSRFGTPQDFMYLVDAFHRAGIGVILDWVASHFPKDAHGLARFDGTCLYEHADPRQGHHPEWDTGIFNYGRREVANFLISNALFWLRYYHVDGLRVDAVASMLHLDYARGAGEWIPNAYGGRENIGAIDFLRRLNERVYAEFPDVMTIAEESTSWPMVSRPVYVGGLGFGLKWNMGWMHDVLDYTSLDPVFRAFHHQYLTFGLLYAFHENFVLPLSHDEVVHLKKSLLSKMPGDDWQKHANLRTLFGYMMGHPGKKLLFMGGEIGQWHEWDHDSSLEWHLLQHAPHAGLQLWVRDLHHLYRRHPALFQRDFEPGGFCWIEVHDSQQSVVAFERRGFDETTSIVFVCNFTPVVRRDYRVGVPFPGRWDELLNSDSAIYGGSDVGNSGGVDAQERSWHGRPYSLNLVLPPLGTIVLRGRAPRPAPVT